MGDDLPPSLRLAHLAFDSPFAAVFRDHLGRVEMFHRITGDDTRTRPLKRSKTAKRGKPRGRNGTSSPRMTSPRSATGSRMTSTKQSEWAGR